MDPIVIEDLTKAYKPNWPGLPSYLALDKLSLTVKRGEIYGFLGPNGAGKTTTLKILLGLMKPSGGSAMVLGRPAGDVEARRHIGYLPEAPYFYDYLTAEEFLFFYGYLAGMRRADLVTRVASLLDLVGLAESRNRQLRKFSKGMLQRIGLAQALIHDPDLVMLDEPMSGLDPIGRKQIRDLILGLREKGKTVFFSSHIIPDVEMMCDRVGVLMKGRLVASGRVDDLVGNGHTKSVDIVCEGMSSAGLPVVTRLAEKAFQRGVQCLLTLSGRDRLEDVLAAIRLHGGTLVSVSPQKGSLEELFIGDNRSKTSGEI